ncbi:hypothetical protein Tsubulata_004591 [Turnera subulata]|uniref:Peptidase A1 domain-containing protein n=1 Tax=Turnera subulata TaxID=218843 RepID=A0A9Q0GH19_9ROSI|nr:hypothetical protein Tsubulata_004591 [Turnera subulata]
MAGAASWLIFPLSLSCLLLLTSSTTITIPIFHHSTKHSSSDHPVETLNYLAALSLRRALHLKSPARSSTNLSSNLVEDEKIPLFPRSYGGYSFSLSFGTPPQTTKMVMDTGSSLVWFPCTSRYRCSSCNFPNVTPILTFIPNLSSTSKLVGCKNPRCSMLLGPSVLSNCKETCDPPTSQNCTTSTCPPYIIQYGSGATSGLLLIETLHLPHNKTLPDFLVGCSILSIRQPEGIAGFGRSPESLPSQLGAKKFSYCLVSHRFDDNPEASSDLVLETGSGSGGDAKTRGLSYTPFVKNPPNTFQDYYYVLLRKIVVGSKNVGIPYKFLAPGADGNGGTIVDSGSTFTFMERAVYELVAKAFEDQMVNFTAAKEVENRTGLRPCFNISGAKEDIFVPKLILHFKGGAKMSLPAANYFSFLGGDVVCLTIVSNGVVGPGLSGGPSIILGNYQQQNFQIEYDLENHRFGFKQQICSSAD